jgi:hypothetical protein
MALRSGSLALCRCLDRRVRLWLAIFVRHRPPAGGCCGSPQAGNPLEDPGKSLQSIGCRTHEPVSLTIDGSGRVVDLISWPGAPRTPLLRFETGSTEVIMETGLLGRDALLALAQRLVSLQHSAQTVALLQSVFGATTIELAHSVRAGVSTVGDLLREQGVR